VGLHSRSPGVADSAGHVAGEVRMDGLLGDGVTRHANRRPLGGHTLGGPAELACLGRPLSRSAGGGPSDPRTADRSNASGAPPSLLMRPWNASGSLMTLP